MRVGGEGRAGQVPGRPSRLWRGRAGGLDCCGPGAVQVCEAGARGWRGLRESGDGRELAWDQLSDRAHYCPGLHMIMVRARNISP